MLQTKCKCSRNPWKQGKKKCCSKSGSFISSQQDFFYVCASHLKDKAFAVPVIDEAAIAAKKKQELDAEVERVKKEFEEKQKKKNEREKDKEKGKDKDKDKDKDKKDDKPVDEKVSCILVQNTEVLLC